MAELQDTGVYSNQQIYSALRTGQIVIHPLNPNHINSTSVDVTLGKHYYRVSEDPSTGLVYNPWDKDHVDKHFIGPFEAEPHEVVIKKLGLQALQGFSMDHPMIPVAPGEGFLGHTHEFIGIREPSGTTSMQARSTSGRNRQVVCLDAGWGDNGFVSRWTMEMYNMHQTKYLLFPVGQRIAQLVFFHTGVVTGEYAKLSGKYQTLPSDDINAIIENWEPSAMIPKAYKDVIEPLPAVGAWSQAHINETLDRFLVEAE